MQIILRNLYLAKKTSQEHQSEGKLILKANPRGPDLDPRSLSVMLHHSYLFEGCVPSPDRAEERPNSQPGAFSNKTELNPNSKDQVKLICSPLNHRDSRKNHNYPNQKEPDTQ